MIRKILMLFPKYKDNLISTPLSQTDGIYYKKEKGMIPKIVEVNFKERKEFKEMNFSGELTLISNDGKGV